MNTEQNAIQIAVLNAEMNHLKTAFTMLTQTLSEQNAKLDRLTTVMNKAEGGWRTLLLVGGAVGSLGGVIGWFAAHWR